MFRHILENLHRKRLALGDVPSNSKTKMPTVQMYLVQGIYIAKFCYSISNITL